MRSALANRKRRPRRTRWICLLCGLTGLLLTYLFSSQTTTDSQSISKQLAHMVIDLIPSLRRLPETQLTHLVEVWNLVLRKAAHFTLYLIVAVFLTLFVDTFALPLFAKGAVVIGVVLVCASLDEWHQTFVPGRTGSFRDVLLDTGGALVGAVAVLTINQCLQRRSRRSLLKEENEHAR